MKIDRTGTLSLALFPSLTLSVSTCAASSLLVLISPRAAVCGEATVHKFVHGAC